MSTNSNLKKYFGIFVDYCDDNNYEYTIVPYFLKSVMIVKTNTDRYEIENYYFSNSYKITNKIGMHMSLHGFYFVSNPNILSKLLK